MPEVSVILVHYKNIDDTSECVKSILASKGVGVRIIIVDNSQPNDHRLDELSRMSNSIEVIYNTENTGFSRANNIGIRWVNEHTKSDHYFILNNDTIIEEETIQKLVNAFDLNEKIGITTCKIVYASNPSIVWYGGASINYLKGWPEVADLNRSSSPDGAGRSKFVDFVSGCAMMISSDAMKKLQGFEEQFFMYGEDLELCMRAKEENIRMYYIADTTIYHKVHGSIDDDAAAERKNVHPKNPHLDFLYYHIRSNQYFTMKKHLKGGRFLIFFFYFWIKYIYTFFRMILHGRFDFFRTCNRTFKRILKGQA